MNIFKALRPQTKPTPDTSEIDALAHQLSQEQAMNADLRGQIERLNAASIAEQSSHQGQMNTVMRVLDLVYRDEIPAWMAIATVDKLMKEAAH
ncbi:MULTISPECIES: hypothetical protein [unclassified Rhizobium]|uniref:hypothetical protein n=1 Tax=unclassified Rhizobium TaxID=2613769 RepID=UPI0007EBF9BD|nr:MULTISPECIES: hypothetical protein [unclassified Rhizobium]ANL12016.1 hypothetical protein AMJ98_PA00070 [Rhizobium sp. N1341]ANM42861.1 hypothetical protein AMK03_PA00070 [Rhizobium sp. N741]